jgi:malate synthase
MQYLHAWLSGNGAAGIDNLMEDAATAEISRSQIWQWTHSATTLATGETVTRELVESVVTDELAALRKAGWYADHLDAARDIFVATALDDEFVDFLTLPAYAQVVRAGE